MRQVLENSQQTAIKFHAISDSTDEKNHDTYACKCSVSPEVIWNQRRAIVLYPKVHPIDKCWHREDPNDEKHYLGSFANIVDVGR
jgi:hypothetical protein